MKHEKTRGILTKTASIILVPLFLFCLNGCARAIGSYSMQSFTETTVVLDGNGAVVLDSNGNPLVNVAKGKSITAALPFGSGGVADHGLQIYRDGKITDAETGDVTQGGFAITMGTNSDVKGGDIAPVIKETGAIVGKLEPLSDTLHLLLDKSKP